MPPPACWWRRHRRRYRRRHRRRHRRRQRLGHRRRCPFLRRRARLHGWRRDFPVYDDDDPEPAEGECFVDPHYGTALCKAVDDARFPFSETGGVIRPIYSRWRHDSSDGSRYFLQKDGETPVDSGKGQLVAFARSNDETVEVFDVYSGEAAEFRWDQSGENPDRLFYVDGCRLMSYEIGGGSNEVHDFGADFPSCGRILNDVEGDASRDSRYWAFMVQGEYDGGEYPMQAVITYDRVEDEILGTIETSVRPNMVDISPLGTHVLALWPRTDDGDSFDGPHAYELDFSSPLQVCNDETHGGWAFSTDGDEVYVCQVSNSNWDAAPADTIAATNLETGKTDVILFHEDLGWGLGFHFGRDAGMASAGWFYVTTHPEGDERTFFTNTAAMVELKPYDEHPRIWRIADTHNDYPGPDGYAREAYSPISGDGRLVLWGADWVGGDETVDTYRVDLPENWMTWLDSAEPCD